MSNVVAAVDSVVQKVEQYALVLVGGGIAAFTAVDPTTLPHKWGASLLVANGILITLKPYLQKAVTVTQAFGSGNSESTITSVVDKVTGEVKHVVTLGDAALKTVEADVPKVEVVTKDEVKVAKDEVNSAPAAVVTADQTKAAADAAAARADLEKQAAAAKATLAAVEAALNANPTVPAGPGA